MAVTNYYSVDSDILGEKTTASSRIDYLTDALGSVTATLNQSAQVVNTYRYKPYGAQLAKTGTAADPAFTWVGAQGYRQTGRKYSDVYVRARHYDTTTARWNTKDPIGFNGGDWNLYRYVANNPISGVDPSGLVYQKHCDDFSDLCIFFSYDYPPIPKYPCQCATWPAFNKSQKTHLSSWVTCCSDPTGSVCLQYVADDIYCCTVDCDTKWDLTLHLLHYIGWYNGRCSKTTGRCKGADAKINDYKRKHHGWKITGKCPV